MSSIRWRINLSFHKARWMAGGKKNTVAGSMRSGVQGQIFLV